MSANPMTTMERATLVKALTRAEKEVARLAAMIAALD